MADFQLTDLTLEAQAGATSRQAAEEAEPVQAEYVVEAPEERRKHMPPLPGGIEARVELFHSHAFTCIAAVLQSFDEGFSHTYFDRIVDTALLSEEFANDTFRVAYCLNETGRDEVRVAWNQQVSATNHGDAELLALARQVAHLLGGGTNLRLVMHKR